MRFALALAFSFTSRPPDRWLAHDKFKHFVAAAAIQSVAYAAWDRAGTSRNTALWRATAVTATISLGKEAFDRSRGRVFSVKDLAWDAGGAGTATLAIIHWSQK